ALREVLRGKRQVYGLVFPAADPLVIKGKIEKRNHRGAAHKGGVKPSIGAGGGADAVAVQEILVAVIESRIEIDRRCAVQIENGADPAMSLYNRASSARDDDGL